MRKAFQWIYTMRLALLLGLGMLSLQVLLGIYAILTQPPTPPGFASFGASIMLGSPITGVLFALVGATFGVIIDFHRNNTVK
ncbi:MAG: hypothetical protein MUD03_11400 [Pirellula sp.]|jgi:hypothetical protein|nr:hypothetical protein [Pirellula sp.]